MADPLEALLRTLGLSDDKPAKARDKKRKPRRRWGKTEIIRSYGPGRFRVPVESGDDAEGRPRPIPMASRQRKRPKGGRGRKRTA